MTDGQAVHTERAVQRVLRPYTELPDRRSWDGTDLEPYLAKLPETLAGLLRQFTAHALDLGHLGFDDPARYKIFRSKIFDTRDALFAQLADWLEFYGVTDEQGAVRADLLDHLLGACDPDEDGRS